MDAGLSGSSFHCGTDVSPFPWIQGDGPKPVPYGAAPLWGATLQAANPTFVQALPSGTAMKRVPCVDFTRINTDFLPLDCASATALRTSAGEETALPLTSRMTSPVWKRSPAVPLGSTWVTTTPSPPFRDGASDRPSFDTSEELGWSRCSPASARACRSFGNSPSVSV